MIFSALVLLHAGRLNVSLICAVAYNGGLINVAIDFSANAANTINPTL